MSFKCDHLALGGTFDLLHKGHKDFLEFAFQNGEKISIGVTSDKMANENGKNLAQNIAVRKDELKKFLFKKRFITRSQIILLDDIYGPTLSDQTIDGLVVTRDTIRGGRLINQKRKELGFATLPLISCSLILADDGQLISSTRIKQGIISREGASYYKSLNSRPKFVITDFLRQKLSQPQGKLFTNLDQLTAQIEYQKHLIITVGDEITKNFLKKNIIPNLAIIDFKINRKEVFTKISDLGFEGNQTVTFARNDPGTINHSLILAIEKFFQERSSGTVILSGAKNLFSTVIKVNGEEDLAVIPCVLLAPLGSLVFYGQRDQGIVKIEVTESKKAEFMKILEQFH